VFFVARAGVFWVKGMGRKVGAGDGVVAQNPALNLAVNAFVRVVDKSYFAKLANAAWMSSAQSLIPAWCENENRSHDNTT